MACADDVEALRAEASGGGVGLPASILKSARLGYDGRGQHRCDDVDAVAAAYRAMGEVPCVLETRVPLLAELSVVLARGGDGRSVAFPPAANEHRAGVLHVSTVPSGLDPALEARAVAAAGRLADGLGYVGGAGGRVLRRRCRRDAGRGSGRGGRGRGGRGRPAAAVQRDGPAPAQQRALGRSTRAPSRSSSSRCAPWPGCRSARRAPLSPVTMLNVMGDAWEAGAPAFDEALALPGASLHLYGKAAARPGRKMGHVNCLAGSAPVSEALAERVHALLSGMR